MKTNDPFFVRGPAVLSFSGGRTSGYMLRRCLDAHGGTLPADVRVVFCNTGKERPETLEFVERCSLEWAVPVTWLEYRNERLPREKRREGKRGRQWRHDVAEVNYATASRAGEPFDMVIRARSFLPNQSMRFCTGELKIKTTARYVRQALGWASYLNLIGLRHDEPQRYAKVMAPPPVTVLEPTLFGPEKVTYGHRKEHIAGEEPCCPLYEARVTLADVTAFWALAPFDLALKPHEGNCDLCFLKGVDKLLAIMRERPDLARWWVEKETTGPKTRSCETERFRKSGERPPYADLLRMAQGNDAFKWDEDDSLPCHCTD